MRSFRTTPLWLLLALSVACSTTIVPDEPPERPAPECSEDFECDPGEVCSIESDCVEGVIPPGGCAFKADCPQGEVCVDSACADPPASCANSEECPGPLLCDGFSGNCFDPDAIGCQSDNECRLEPGCDDGCACTDGVCGGPIDPPPVGGDPIDLDGFSLENREHNPPIQVGILNGVTLSPGQILVIGRNATKNAFEADWNVTFGTDVVYFNNDSENGGIPVINGNERWALVSSSGTLVDESIEGSAGNSYQRVGAALDWLEVNDDAATPGSVDLPSSGIGLVISEWSDASGTGRFPFEFIELYFAP